MRRFILALLVFTTPMTLFGQEPLPPFPPAPAVLYDVPIVVAPYAEILSSCATWEPIPGNNNFVELRFDCLCGAPDAYYIVLERWVPGVGTQPSSWALETTVRNIPAGAPFTLTCRLPAPNDYFSISRYRITVRRWADGLNLASDEYSFKIPTPLGLP